MGSSPTKKNSDLKPQTDASEEEQTDLGVTFSGSAEDGHHVSAQDERLCEVLGTKNPETAHGLITHCIKVLRNDEASDEAPCNDERIFMASAVDEIGPRDGLEAMLATQMAATHVAVIRSARWLANAETIPQVQSHYTGYNKLTRTFAAQMETLRKYRNGGKQTVTVQHVNVEDGGQAIVGNVDTRGRGRNEK